MMQNAFCVCRSLAVFLLLANDAVLITTQQTPDFAQIVLAWPEPVVYTASIDGRELLLRFGRPISFDGTEEIAKQIPQWIEATALGFDTMLIRAAREVTFETLTEGNTIRIRMTPTPTPPRPDASEPEQEEGRLRVQILQAQLRMAERRTGAAEALLERVVTEHPQNVPALSSLGQVEQQIGRWRRAYNLYNRVLRLDPDNKEVRVLRSEVLADESPRMRLDSEIKTITGDRIERIGRAAGTVFFSQSLRFGITADENHVTTLTDRFDRQRGEAFLQQDFEGGSQLRFSFFDNRKRSGGGMRFMRSDSTGRFQMQADYRRPFWEFLETLKGYGTRDRAEVHRDQHLGKRLDGRVTAAFNRYGLQRDNIANSLAFDGGLAMAILRQNPYLGIEYSFDIESLRHLEAGSIPLVSREVHALSLATQVHLSRQVYVEGFGGYVRDRLGERGQGPFTGARFTVGGSSRLGLQFWYDRRLNLVATSQTVEQVGAYLYWRFR